MHTKDSGRFELNADTAWRSFPAGHATVLDLVDQPWLYDTVHKPGSSWFFWEYALLSRYAGSGNSEIRGCFLVGGTGSYESHPRIVDVVTDFGCLRELTGYFSGGVKCRMTEGLNVRWFLTPQYLSLEFED